jgi:hypothetical protein
VASPDVADAGLTGAWAAEATGVGPPGDAAVALTTTVTALGVPSDGPAGLLPAHPASNTAAAHTTDQRFRHTLATVAAIDAARCPQIDGLTDARDSAVGRTTDRTLSGSRSSG